MDGDTVDSTDESDRETITVGRGERNDRRWIDPYCCRRFPNCELFHRRIGATRNPALAMVGGRTIDSV